MLCIRHGTAKERKKIIKGVKGQVDKIACDRCGSVVLVSILSIVDDTKLLSKNIIRELEGTLKELVLDEAPTSAVASSKLFPLFQPRRSGILEFNCPLSEYQESSEVTEEIEDEKGPDETVPDAKRRKHDGKNLHLDEVRKKDPLTRRKELLINSGLAEKLIDACCKMSGDLLRSKFGKEVIYEVATRDADGILHPGMDEKLGKLHEAIVSLVAEPKLGGAEEHLLEHYHSSRTIRKPILDSPVYASTLWEKALKGKCAIWSQGQSSNVILAFLEASGTAVFETAKKELEPLIESGVLRLPAENKPDKTDQDAKMEPV